METLEAIFKRTSTRSFTREPVTSEVVETILKAACAAPAAMAQYESMHITVVQSEDIIAQINQATEKVLQQRGSMRKADTGARTMIFLSAGPTMLSPVMAYANTGIVVENMVIAATDLGIDSLILGSAPAAIAEDKALLTKMGIPEGFTPVLAVALGKATNPEPPKAHSIAIHYV